MNSIRFDRLDIRKFAGHPEINYLHSGDVLQEWFKRQDTGAAALQLSRRAGPFTQTRIPGFLQRALLPARSSQEPCWADPRRFEQNLSDSIEWRKQFRKLGCRGFSYKLDLQMADYDCHRPRTGQLHPNINLRAALMPGRHLFYPATVSRYFASTAWYGNHYYREDLPSIAFCFGRKIERIWYVFTMQSDVSSSGPAGVREHFRGWRNILFANVVAQAWGEKADAIRLCLAKDVVRGCFPGTRNDSERSGRLRWIYDRTATDWRMRVVESSQRVNIQLYKNQQPVFARLFHQFDLTGVRHGLVADTASTT